MGGKREGMNWWEEGRWIGEERRDDLEWVSG